MKALLLAAGLGTRLRPLTFHKAKASIPLLDVPFVHYPLQYLSSNRVTEVVMNLHAHPDSVRSVAGSQYEGMKLHYSYEPEILGTAGAIRKAFPIPAEEGPFVVMNGDMLIDLSLQDTLEQHRFLDADVTLVIMKDDRYSGLYFDAENPPRLRGLRAGEGERYHYTGLQIISPRILERIPENRKTEIFRDIYPELIRNGKIYGYIYKGMWMEIGTLKEYLQTSIQLLEKPLPVHLQPQKMGKSLVSLKATVEAGTTVLDSIVMEGATIQASANLDHCIIGWDVRVSASFKDVTLVRGILPWRIE